MEYLRQYEILLKKAYSDYKVAKLIYESQEDIEIENALFHLQQAVEKAVKAMLIYNEILFPKTHRLDVLFDLIESNSIEIKLEEDFLDLNDYAVEARYDYLSDTFENFQEILNKVEALIIDVENKIKKM